MNGNGLRNRRSFLTRAIGVSAAGAAALVLGAPSEGAQGGRRLRVDADPNDPAHSGLTDADRGAHSDPPGNGRGGRSARRRGVEDADAGASADPVRRGRGPIRGRHHQSTERPAPVPPAPATQGMAGGRPPARSTDTDSGPNSDAIGSGGGPQERFITCPGHRRCPR